MLSSSRGRIPSRAPPASEMARRCISPWARGLAPAIVSKVGAPEECQSSTPHRKKVLAPEPWVSEQSITRAQPNVPSLSGRAQNWPGSS
jgi:hypothetical protein